MFELTKKRMNHIVIDTEMTCFMDLKKDEDGNYFYYEGKKENKVKRYIECKKQEIIEIGAVKLNSDFEVVDEFQCYVKPLNNSLLSGYCRSLTGITQEQIDSAKPFDEAIQDFMNWIGEERFSLYTWSNNDIDAIQRDCAKSNVSTVIKDKLLLRAVNIQKGLSKMYSKGLGLNPKAKTLGLKHAIQLFNIESNNRHHTALGDAKDTAALLIKYQKEQAEVTNMLKNLKSAV